MYRTEKPKWYDECRDYRYPDIEDVATDLRATTKLLEVVETAYFETNIGAVCNIDIMNMLTEDDYHDGKAKCAYEFLSSYSVLLDMIAILYERVEQASNMLLKIDSRKLEKRTISSSRTGDRSLISSLMWDATNVVVPEEIDNIGADVIESLKSNTPEQDIPVVVSRYLMRIAYMLYRDGVYGRSPDESVEETDGVEDDTEDDTEDYPEDQEAE